MTSFDLSARFFLQLAVIIGVCRAASWLGRRALQPPVVCEMVAGVLLGPSLFGLLFPGAFAAVFPKPMMPILFVISQVGLALYMFVVGLEFRTDLLLASWRSSAFVSLAGIAAPMALGGLLGAHLASDPAYFGAGVKAWQAMVFTGAAMSITAFPMLARIIVERGLSGTRIGTLSLGAGAFDDVAAWCLLAVILAVFESDNRIALLALSGGAAYGLFVFLVARPLARELTRRFPEAALGDAGLSIALIALMLAAWFTDYVRLYAVFGAFLMGMAMPRGAFADRLRAKIEPLTTGLIVPLFFAFSGLNTRIGLLDTPRMWAIAGVVLLIATAGKGVACGLAARLSGYPAAEAAAVGTLMNSRGLMELILLNIGLERGLITPTLFTMMVLMAVATTLAASPVFELVRPYLSGGARAPERSRSPIL